MIVPAVSISILMTSVKISDEFMQGIFVGLISPFLLGFFGAIVFALYIQDADQWITWIAGLLGGAGACVLALWFGFKWLNIVKEMQDNFSASQAGLSMSGVAFIGTSIGIFVTYQVIN
ncbi:MAG: hypothetical protein J7647_09320 [Cyanobacteria bacterium SBLK]|nr:hypothetical protein [Cyanobacteria bacterium SBLK]